MPNYTFKDTETNEQFIEFMKIDQKEYFLEENPTLQQVLTPINLTGDHIMGVGPTEPTEFKERMGEIADAHPYSPMADNWGTSATASKRKAQKIFHNVTKKYKRRWDALQHQ